MTMLGSLWFWFQGTPNCYLLLLNSTDVDRSVVKQVSYCEILWFKRLIDFVSQQDPFMLYSAPTWYNRFTINQCLIFCADGTHSASPHHAFVFYLWMKHFTGNVFRQAFEVQSILMYIPIIQKYLNREIWIEVRECVISCHIIHNVLEASSKDSVGVRVGGMETWLLINLVTVDGSQCCKKHKRLTSCVGL